MSEEIANGNGQHEAADAEIAAVDVVATNEEANDENSPESAYMPAPEIITDYKPVPVTIRTMLEAGAQFGHKTERWNPKMLPYIFGQKNGVHIINLDLTVKAWERARKYIVDITSRGGTVLFVGTKAQARTTIQRAAKRSGAFYVNNRWLGGMLSNFSTIKNSLRRMRKLEELLAKAEDTSSDLNITKKESLNIKRQIGKLDINLGGIREMRKHPDVLFVLDVNKEALAIAEARKLHIPVVALVDTNVDPRQVTMAIPSNDDASRTIELFVNAVADAILEGRQVFESRTVKERNTPGVSRSNRGRGATAAASEKTGEESSDGDGVDRDSAVA